MSETATVMREEAATSGLSLTQAVAVGINTTSPAYSLAAILAPMAALVGYATPVVLVVSFIPMALTSLAFLYLNRRDPDCGTTFSWVSRAIGPKSGFLAGWVIASTGILVIGSLAETAVTYGLLLFGQDGLAANRLLVIAAAAVLIMIMVALAIVGSDSSIKLQSALTYLQVGILVAFGVVAFFTAKEYGLPRLSDEWFNPMYFGVQPLVSAMLLGVFAFWGWEAATNLSEECRRPSDAGKAGVLSTIVLLGTYVLVAISVVLYLGQSDFYSVGESGLVLVDMSATVFGPLSFLVLLAVASSALASTQTTMVPGSRAVLSMARRGALPARFGLMHPRFKTPWVSLLTMAVLAASWYVVVSLLSASAMLDTLSSLGILVAFYYSITGIACVVYYRRHVGRSLKGFLLVGVGPTVGSLGLIFMMVAAVQSLWDPAESATGTPWLGLSPPLTIAALMVGLGLTALVIRRFVAPGFFVPPTTETATVLQSPFVLDNEKPLPEGGVLIDCNDSTQHVVAAVNEHLTGEWDPATPFYLVFGVRPAEWSGDEYGVAMHALATDGQRTFTAVAQRLKSAGARSIFQLFEDAASRESVSMVADRTHARTIWSAHSD